MKKYLLFLFFLQNILTAQQQPIAVEPASLLDNGYAQVYFGTAHYRNQFFPLSGLQGNLTKIGKIMFCISLSEFVELQTDGTLLDYLQIKERKVAINSTRTTTRNPTADIGDFTLWTKFKILDEYSFPLACAMRFGVQLPNASNESGLGIDEMNFFSSFLFNKHFLGLWTLNVGLGILGDPTDLSSQHDVCVYGFGYSIPVSASANIVLQTAGRAGHNGVGVNRLASSRVGIEKFWGNLSAAIYGIINHSPIDNAKGVEVSLMYQFNVFQTNNSNDNH